MCCSTAAVLNDEGGLIVKNYVAILDPVTGEAEKDYWIMLRSQEKSRGKKGEEERITEVDGNLMGSIIAQEIIIIIIIILEIDTASLKSLQLLEFEYMSGLPSYFVKPRRFKS